MNSLQIQELMQKQNTTNMAVLVDKGYWRVEKFLKVYYW